MTGTVLVTGGSRGIGAACCRALARDGWAVGVNYRTGKAEAEAVVAEIRAAGGVAEAIQGDVADDAQVVAMFAACDERLPRPLKGLVNNAGVLGDKSTDLQLIGNSEKLQQVMSVNVAGPLFCCREALARMSTQSGGAGGAIVNVSSGSAYIANPVLYGMSKAALNAMQAGLVRTFGEQGVRINTVSPGHTRTDMISESMADPVRLEAIVKQIPLGRVGEPEEIAESVRWLMSPGASFVSGANIRVAGGRPPGTVIG
eukprot:TRINITY_DN18396_c0_g1_i1.p1 TRINITY_DN18396_c0_g1~~TRINITY_DN18396_c0_g1_i1.p1  ORF type:complete len:257 (+),score=59.88 TRINITY_DN18396_c0_g1_i1:73-843(+)